MKIIKLLLYCIIVSILVALTYYLFESLVRNSLAYIWNTVFDSDNNRIVVLPLAIILGLIFFWAQRLLDPKSENKEKEDSEDELTSPTISNLAIILLLGYLSLIAGAALGPEAILVPASMAIGAIVAGRLAKGNKKATKALIAASIIALMTSFFHSVVIGILSLLLVTKQSKVKISPEIVLIAVVSSITSFSVLNKLDSESRYLNLPAFSWRVAIIDLLACTLLVGVGYCATFALKHSHEIFVNIRKATKAKEWWQLGLLATSSIAIFYLIGGPLVEFTGNESIAPLIDQAASLGLLGLLGILVVKILVISWSKAMGYRGGLIFPMIFIAASLVAIVQTIFKDANFGVGLVAAMGGILLAERKAKILL